MAEKEPHPLITAASGHRRAILPKLFQTYTAVLYSCGINYAIIRLSDQKLTGNFLPFSI